ncbi:hypothetical protein [Campylobacter curvus]|jgi:hypothetical protein|uniref:hypothetical protein n=1 Tax=Campylobacter curvus TaxID=200 RepID=UPI0014707753|nr:hypothetical protein [Campylobacter curvus]
MTSEQAYEEYHVRLIQTALELENYKKHNLRYKNFHQILDLYSRVTFYLRELKDQSSLLCFYIDSTQRDEYTKLFSSVLLLIETHLEDTLIKANQIIAKKEINIAKAIVNDLQSKPYDSLEIAFKYKLWTNETFLNYILPISKEYLPVTLLD